MSPSNRMTNDQLQFNTVEAASGLSFGSTQLETTIQNYLNEGWQIASLEKTGSAWYRVTFVTDGRPETPRPTQHVKVVEALAHSIDRKVQAHERDGWSQLFTQYTDTDHVVTVFVRASKRSAAERVSAPQAVRAGAR